MYSSHDGDNAFRVTSVRGPKRPGGRRWTWLLPAVALATITTGCAAAHEDVSGPMPAFGSALVAAANPEAGTTTVPPEDTPPEDARVVKCVAYIPIGVDRGDVRVAALWKAANGVPTEFTRVCADLIMNNPRLLDELAAEMDEYTASQTSP